MALLSLLGQPGVDEVARLIMDAHVKDRSVSSCLIKVEMARAAHRDHFDVRVVDEFIAGVELVEIGPDVIERASALTGELKSLDAIHLATATLLDDPRHPVTVLTHDARLADAARSRGLGAIDPLGS
ncbi:PIN domain-containing protein [Actinomyces oris]|uniref:PIN domain-containing protein n=1 Tax=Actinomyces oris TaxID=544580 RepID=UPI0028D63765|nr:PIN domain-containing protein [Actinomyces oris]